MSFVELDEHPDKHKLMATAFTLQSGIHQGNEIIKAQSEQQAKLKQ